MPVEQRDGAGDGEAQRLRARAEEAEDAARGVAGVTNSEGGAASLGEAVLALATSHGFAGAYATTSHALFASVVAGEGAGMQRDYAYRVARHADDLIPPAEIGALAGARAVARLAPAALPSGPRPVVFDPRIGGSLIGYAICSTVCPGEPDACSSCVPEPDAADALAEPLPTTGITPSAARPWLTRIAAATAAQRSR